MKYFLTDILGQEHVLDLPVTDDITWHDFLNLQQVRGLDIEIVDITPEGMPDFFTDEESRQRQLANLGIKVSKQSHQIDCVDEEDSL